MRSFVIILTLVLFGACADHEVVLDHQAPATRLQEPPGYEVATVTRVVDGDTVVVTVTRIEPGPGAGATLVGQSYPSA